MPAGQADEPPAGMASKHGQSTDLWGNLKGAGPVLSFLPVTLGYVRARLGQLHDREQGVTAIEYALMVAIIALLLVGGFYALFSTVRDRYDVVGDCVASGPNPTTCTAP
jgi:Flp pilus assembly pilin Flp